MKHPLGHINYWAERTRGRLAWIGTFTGIATFIKVYDLSLWWTLTLIPLAAISIFIDKKFIAPGELDAQTKNNPEWNRVARLNEETNRLVKKMMEGEDA